MFLLLAGYQQALFKVKMMYVLQSMAIWIGYAKSAMRHMLVKGLISSKSKSE